MMQANSHDHHMNSQIFSKPHTGQLCFQSKLGNIEQQVRFVSAVGNMNFTPLINLN